MYSGGGKIPMDAKIQTIGPKQMPLKIPRFSRELKGKGKSLADCRMRSTNPIDLTANEQTVVPLTEISARVTVGIVGQQKTILLTAGRPP